MGAAPKYTPDLPPEWEPPPEPAPYPRAVPDLPLEPEPPIEVPPGLEPIDVPPLGLPLFVFLFVLLWPSETAPAWMDEINPVTGMPYGSKKEYDDLWRQGPEEVQRQVAERRSKQAAEAQKKASELSENDPLAPVPCPAAGPQPVPGPAPAQQPTATPVAQPEPRKYPEQTCDEDVRKKLRDEKNRICGAIPGPSASPSRSEKMLARIPCSKLRARIRAQEECLKARQRIKDECFNTPPDPSDPEQVKRADDHQRAMNELATGIENSKNLAKVNCAPGHPMANL